MTKRTSSRKRDYRILLTAGLIGSLASAPADAAGTNEIDACLWLTVNEISQLTGYPIDNGVRIDEGLQVDGSYSSTCVWVIQQEQVRTRDPAAPLGGRSFVILNAMQWPANSGLAGTFLQAFRDAAVNGHIPSAPVPREFGDEALWWGDGLAVRTGDTSFGISVVISDPESRSPMWFAERLAPHVLQRLAQRDPE